MSVVEGTTENFEEVVKKEANKAVLVDFWAEWCGPCKALGPKLDELASENAENLKVVKVNVDNHPDLAQNYGVRGIPALFLFKNGEVINQTAGNKSKEELQNFVSL